MITALGTSSPYPRPQDPCSSFLLQSAGHRLWIDAGAGTLSSLLRHSSLQELDAIWISHTHADHFSDMAVTFYALRYADIRRPLLPVYGPPGWSERLGAFLSHTASPSPLAEAFDIHEISNCREVTVGDLELTPFEVHHDAPCFGVRIRSEDLVVSYTGDTGPCTGLSELAEGADLLISEAGYGLDGGEDDPVHLTAAQAGATARDGKVGQLLLTHLAGTDVAACVAAASEVYSGPVIGAHPGLIVTV